MSAPASFRTKPVDRRRLTMEERQSYRPEERLTAIARAKAFKGNLSYNQKRKPFATEQKPGSGGFKQGRGALPERLRQEGYKEARAKSFRPENAVSSELYDKLT